MLIITYWRIILQKVNVMGIAFFAVIIIFFSSSKSTKKRGAFEIISCDGCMTEVLFS